MIEEFLNSPIIILYITGMYLNIQLKIKCYHQATNSCLAKITTTTIDFDIGWMTGCMHNNSSNNSHDMSTQTVVKTYFSKPAISATNLSNVSTYKNTQNKHSKPKY